MKKADVLPTKERMVFALMKHFGVVTAARESIGLARTTHNEWYENDPAYRDACDFASTDLRVDKAEQRLDQLIDSSDDAIALKASLKVLESKGRKRGWGAEQKIVTETKEAPNGFTINIVRTKDGN